MIFLELWQRPHGPTPGASERSHLHASLKGPLRIALKSLPGPRCSSGVEAKTSGFFSRADMDLRISLGHPQDSQALSRVEPGKSALISSQKSSVSLPVWLTIGICGFLSRCHRSIPPAIVF